MHDGPALYAREPQGSRGAPHTACWWSPFTRPFQLEPTRINRVVEPPAVRDDNVEFLLTTEKSKQQKGSGSHALLSGGQGFESPQVHRKGRPIRAAFRVSRHFAARTHPCIRGSWVGSTYGVGQPRSIASGRSSKCHASFEYV